MRAGAEDAAALVRHSAVRSQRTMSTSGPSRASSRKVGRAKAVPAKIIRARHRQRHGQVATAQVVGKRVALQRRLDADPSPLEDLELLGTEGRIGVEDHGLPHVVPLLVGLRAATASWSSASSTTRTRSASVATAGSGGSPDPSSGVKVVGTWRPGTACLRRPRPGGLLGSSHWSASRTGRSEGALSRIADPFAWRTGSAATSPPSTTSASPNGTSASRLTLGGGGPGRSASAPQQVVAARSRRIVKTIVYGIA